MAYQTEFKADQITKERTNSDLAKRSTEFTDTRDILIAEGGENFFNYVDGLGMVQDPDLVVLSSVHHYFYDNKEMNNFKTVINIKELNQIKQIKSFLHSCLLFMPQNSNFIGCFTDNNKINGYKLKESSTSAEDDKSCEDIENSIVSRNPFINMLYSIMDLKTNTYMSKLSTSLMLEDNGFKVKNMTEINGLTFFHAQKSGLVYN
jgi:hypothetical protein